jgi:hypothetical protein
MKITTIGRGNIGGGLEHARLLEEHIGLMSAISNGGLGHFVYRYAKPAEL